MKDESYICHLIIPTKNPQTAKIFFRQVFGWTVEKQPQSDSLDVLPPSRKGPSAELNPNEDRVIPSIYTSQIKMKLKLVEKFGGKTIKGKTPIGQKAQHGYYALFEDPDGNKMCLYSDR